jgi:hypothetical protein
MAYGTMRIIGMPGIRIGSIDITRNGLSIARTGGWPTIAIIPSGSSLRTGDGIRCGPTAPMTGVTSGATRDGWRERDPAWFYAHHPEWAEAHPGWIRDDHGRHPEWFHSAYWTEHPRDWNHPDEEYRKELSRNVEYERSHAALANDHENVHEEGVEHRNIASVESRPPATTVYHAPAAYHPAVTTSSGHSSGGGSHSGKH